MKNAWTLLVLITSPALAALGTQCICTRYVPGQGDALVERIEEVFRSSDERELKLCRNPKDGGQRSSEIRGDHFNCHLISLDTSGGNELRWTYPTPSATPKPKPSKGPLPKKKKNP